MKFWYGKVIGALLGLIVARSFLGVVIGVVLGHFFDKYVSKKAQGGLSAQDQAQQIRHYFFRATFRFMGRLAKADGRVSEAEIAAASHVMQLMRLEGKQRQVAIEYFAQGKDPKTDLDGDLFVLKNLFRARQDLLVMFLEIQLSVAYADGELSRNERLVLDSLRVALGVPEFHFEAIHQRVLAAMRGSYQAQNNNAEQLKNAYAVLGVDERINDADLKKAYRKLMSQHHPDKLVAKGLPEEMMTLAKEKTQAIQTAYDLIVKARAQ
ncbi:MAG: hypothetical protein RL217_1693 [Pseudomonadota bacterium]|jgi:DnaJ like chaperone protein